METLVWNRREWPHIAHQASESPNAPKGPYLCGSRSSHSQVNLGPSSTCPAAHERYSLPKSSGASALLDIVRHPSQPHFQADTNSKKLLQRSRQDSTGRARVSHVTNYKFGSRSLPSLQRPRHPHFSSILLTRLLTDSSTKNHLPTPTSRAFSSQWSNFIRHEAHMPPFKSSVCDLLRVDLERSAPNLCISSAALASLFWPSPLIFWKSTLRYSNYLSMSIWRLGVGIVVRERVLLVVSTTDLDHAISIPNPFDYGSSALISTSGTIMLWQAHVLRQEPRSNIEQLLFTRATGRTKTTTFGQNEAQNVEFRFSSECGHPLDGRVHLPSPASFIICSIPPNLGLRVPPLLFQSISTIVLNHINANSEPELNIGGR